MNEEVIQQFYNTFGIDPASFTKAENPEQWIELFAVLAFAWRFKFAESDRIYQEIDTFGSLNSDQKTARIIELNNYFSQQAEELYKFDDLYGDRLFFHTIETTVANLPRIEDKISYLFTIDTGFTPEQDPERFGEYAYALLKSLDPELAVDDRLKTVMNDRNRLHLGTTEARRSRAISAEEVQNYIQNRPGMPNSQPSAPSGRNANLVQPQLPQVPPQNRPRR